MDHFLKTNPTATEEDYHFTQEAVKNMKPLPPIEAMKISHVECHKYITQGDTLKSPLELYNEYVELCKNEISDTFIDPYLEYAEKFKKNITNKGNVTEQ